jgi:hypothetical protein
VEAIVKPVDALFATYIEVRDFISSPANNQVIRDIDANER